MAKLRYDTVREVSYSPDQLTLLSDSLQSMGQLYSLSQLISSGPDPIRLAQVKDVIETVTTGRKYQVLLLRSQGKTFAEIALLLEISMVDFGTDMSEAPRDHLQNGDPHYHHTAGLEALLRSPLISQL